MSALANGKKLKPCLMKFPFQKMKADVSRFIVKMLASIQDMNSDVYASRKAQALFLMSLQFWVTPKQQNFGHVFQKC